MLLFMGMMLTIVLTTPVIKTDGQASTTSSLTVMQRSLEDVQTGQGPSGRTSWAVDFHFTFIVYTYTSSTATNAPGDGTDD